MKEEFTSDRVKRLKKRKIIITYFDIANIMPKAVISMPFMNSETVIAMVGVVIKANYMLI